MIEDVISISTLMICTFLSTMVVGIFMLQVWLTDRRHAAAGYWCFSQSTRASLESFMAFMFALVVLGLVLNVIVSNW